MPGGRWILQGLNNAHVMGINEFLTHSVLILASEKREGHRQFFWLVKSLRKGWAWRRKSKSWPGANQKGDKRQRADMVVPGPGPLWWCTTRGWLMSVQQWSENSTSHHRVLGENRRRLSEEATNLIWPKLAVPWEDGGREWLEKAGGGQGGCSWRGFRCTQASHQKNQHW